MNNAESIIDINHVVKLAKLNLNESDSEHFSKELNKILEYINMLKEADVSGVNVMSGELDYDNLVSGVALKTNFYKDCRLDECIQDDSFSFNIVKNDAPNFETSGETSEYGFFVVPQVIE